MAAAFGARSRTSLGGALQSVVRASPDVNRLLPAAGCEAIGYSDYSHLRAVIEREGVPNIYRRSL